MSQLSNNSFSSMSKERIHKVIANAGVTSRRKAEALIREGRVVVDGQRVTKLGTTVDPKKSAITIDGKRVEVGVRKTYILLNKPRGCITSLHDPLERATVVDLLGHKLREQRVYPVGRLDYDAEGLLLLTNDGTLANRLLHPSFSVPRTYLVKLKGYPSRETIKKLRSGIRLSDGPTLPARIKFLGKTASNSWVQITVTEGRNNLIKRMFMAVGHRVLKLKRIQFGSLTLGDIPSGKYRVLRSKEVEKLLRVFDS
jgi:pseudouridine synthase